ncbi:MAG: methyltransferase domain-containing protein [Myxococcus sp.]|nr:methyltransferase domain-containing protein [Myxococcus sp.]
MSGDREPLFELVSRRSGSALSRQQRARVAALAERLSAGRSAAEFLDHLNDRRGALTLLELMAAASVHKTDLFRDEAQLEALERHVLEPLARRGRPLELWSAGCSTGEEVATLLLLLARVGAHPGSRVLGTDLSEAALSRARLLTFSDEAMRRVPAALVSRHFERTASGMQLSRQLAAQARFQQHNLVDPPYPFPEGASAFDVIVCRNVLIYFTADAVDQTVTWLGERLAPHGRLVLSAAEPLLKPRGDLETVRLGDTFFYARRDRPLAPPPPVPPPRPSAPAPPPALAPPALAEVVEAPPGPPPEVEGDELFSLVLEWSAAGQDDSETEAGLRKALYLSPQLAAARYCLGLLLEQRGQRADAATEYRRALSLLEQGQARQTPFFLNAERLTTACRLAHQRVSR